MKKTLALTAALALLGFAGAADAGQRVVVEKNHVVRVSLGGSAGSVIVGNPDIADVSVVDSRTIYIIGKGFGNSAVSVTDQAGRPLFDGEIVVTAAQKGAITVYKGLKPSLMVCTNICLSEDANSGNASAATSPAPNGLPASVAAVGSTAGAGAGGMGAISGTAMQVQ